MSNKRIDMEYFTDKYTFMTPTDPNWNGRPWGKADLKMLLDELNRMYEREDALFNAIKELRDSEDSTGCSEDLTVVRLTPMQILYELFPDTAYWGCACQGPHTGPC